VHEAKAIVEELKKYDQALYEKPRWLILNKIDMLPDSAQVVKKFVKDYGWKGPVFAISAISGIGCKELTYAIMEHIEESKRLALQAEEANSAFKQSGLINESLPSKTVEIKEL
jgi:GTP-binding protein